MFDWTDRMMELQRPGVWSIAAWGVGAVAAVGVLALFAAASPGGDAGGAVVPEGEEPLPEAKPVPAMQVLPLPHHQASFQRLGRELMRYHFAPTQHRPFWYPLIGPSGRSHTRMGHPRDPVSHSHHNSVWISHQNVGGSNFWEDSDKCSIVHRRVDQYEDSDAAAWMLSQNDWRTSDGRVLMRERRRACVRPLEAGEWLMDIDLQLEAPGKQALVLGETPFGIIGVRMAKTIGIHDGGGRILNSAGQRNEKPCFRKPAKWVDYSGPIVARARGGITLMDHPQNPGHPTPFHVRGDGWMGACLTLRGAITIQPGKPLRLRYGLWVHAGVPTLDRIEKRWQAFAKTKLPTMVRRRK